ncbi:hypothetical protein BpHYR1_044947 [Brachionus plicatilis]|uniref:Uncharacterized protein n=1 Tax=Brachionus plicatilis TaxID=10195 RepID=A0A3M7S0X0_BRAPC|nr:hypothetical protein BpHYR1_044947 [Brachionus plicatilis]
MSAIQPPTASKAQLPTASTLQKQLNFPTASTLIKSFDDHVNGKFGSSLNAQQPALSLNAALAAPAASAAPALTSKAQLPTSSKAQLPTASTLQKQFNFPTASTLIKSFDDHVAGKFDSSLLNAQQQSDASPAAPAASVAPAQPGNFQLPTSSSLERQFNLPTSSGLFKKFNDQSGSQFGSNFNAQQPALSFSAAAPAAPSTGAVPPPDCPCHLKKLLNKAPALSAAPAQADFSAQFSEANFGNNQSFGNFDLNSFSNNNQLPQSFGGNFNFGSNNFGSLF